MLFSQKEKEKQQSSIVALQAKPQESANPWSKYGSLVEKDNIADEDGVIDLLADNLLVDPSTGGVIKVDPALLSWKKQTLAAGKTTDTNTVSSENAAKPQAQSGIIAQAVQPKHSGGGKSLGGRGGNAAPNPTVPTVEQKPQSAKTTILQSQAKEQISGVQPKQDEKNGWDIYHDTINTVDDVTKTLDGAVLYDESAIKYNEKKVNTGTAKLLIKEDVIEQVNKIGDKAIYDAAKNVSTLPIGKTLTALDVTTTCTNIVDDWVKNGTLTKESGKEITGVLASGAMTRLAASWLVTWIGTGMVIKNPVEQAKISAKCLALVTIINIWLDTQIRRDTDSLIDFLTSEGGEAYFQEIAENNLAIYQKEQADMLALQKKRQQEEQAYHELQKIGDKKKQEYYTSVMNNLEESMKKRAQENYAQLPQETLDEMDYYSKYAKDILKQIGYNK